jgi:hypothetical protein
VTRYPTCALCGHEIFEADHRLMNKQVVGYEQPRKKGGLHALRLKTETGAVAHDHCVALAVTKVKAGTSVSQGGLF